MNSDSLNGKNSEQAEAFRQACELLRAVGDDSLTAIVRYDAHGRITSWNDAASWLFGYTSSDVMGRTFPDSPDDARAFQRVFQRVLKGETVRNAEVVRMRKDGLRVHTRVCAAPLRDNDGTITGAITVNEDIGLSREALAELRQQEARWRTVLETVPDAIIVIDHRGAIQSFSSAAERQFGYSADEVIGQNISILMPSPYREEHDRYIDRYQKTHQRRIIGIGREVVGQRKNGTVFPMYLSVGEGKLEGQSLYVGIIHDITEQQATERKLRELQEELLQVSRISGMGQMASSLAHELNQPLTAVGSLMQAARRMLEVGDPAAIGRARDAVERAGQQILRAGEIIRRLREFAARGDTEKVVVPVDILLSEAISLARISNKFGTTRVELLLGKTPPVLVDKIQIQQVILNLLRNGLEAMEAVSTPLLTVSSRMSDDMVEVAVADVGPGIPAEVRTRLFEPFLTTKQNGMGVGLAICRTIIEAQGGRLFAEDNPGGGTVFRFTLTRAMDEDDDGGQ